jgi:hypothetical protein
LQLVPLLDFAAIRTSVLGARNVSLAHAAQREYNRRKQYRGKPNPYKFALNDGEPSWREKTRDSDWRNANRSPWQEIAVVVEGGEKRDPQPTIRYGIEQAVAGCGQK